MSGIAGDVIVGERAFLPESRSSVYLVKEPRKPTVMLVGLDKPRSPAMGFVVGALVFALVVALFSSGEMPHVA